jgi:hypothetical protein
MSLRFFAFGAAMVGILLACSADSLGQTNAQQSGNWSTGSTWGSGEPTSTSPAIINGGHTVTIDQNGETTNLLDVGTINGETGNVNMTGGDLTIADSGAPPDLPSIRLGQVAGSTGNFTMSQGTVFINGGLDTPFAVGDMMVGDGGSGNFTMTGGQFFATDEVFVALLPGSSGVLDVSGGLFEIQGRNLLVGWEGDAEFNLSGSGTVNITGAMFTGFFPASTSTITQTGGTLNLGLAVILGRQADTTYNHSSGSIFTQDIFIVGDNFEGPGLTATYNISGDADTTVTGAFHVGRWAGADGTVNQSGGTVTAAGFIVGHLGTGTWNMDGGTLNQVGGAFDPANNNLVVGRDQPSTFDQTAGQVNITNGNVFLGDFDTSEGTYKISGGTLGVSGNFSVGGALASNAAEDRVEPDGTNGPQGQALDANGTFIVSGSAATIDIGGNFLANPDDKSEFRSDPFIAGADNSATLVFEIFNSSGTSLIDVAGVADLDGAVIDIDLMGGFTPTIGATFDLLAASSFGSTGTGTTQNVGTGEGFSLAAEDVGSFSLAVISDQVLRATFLSSPMGVPGDYNDDGTVDAADYVTWRKNEGTNNPLPNDPIGGMIGQQHYDQWRDNFGDSLPGSGSRALAAVPEPSTAILLLGMLVGALWLRR